MRPSAGAGGGVVVLLLSAVSAAQDVPLSVPLEYTSGFATGTSSPTVFAGGVRAGLLARLGREGTMLAGPAAGVLYDGAGWAAVGGVRGGLRVPGMGARDGGLYLFAEALKGRGRAPISVHLLADLPVRPALFARFGASFTRDLD